jgi:signal transduction histidine kinase
MIFARARRRLMALNVAVLVIIILVLGATIILLLDRVLLTMETASLQSDTARAATEAGERRGPDVGALHGTYVPGTFYLLWDARGQPVADPDHVVNASLAERERRAAAGQASTATLQLSGGGDALVASQPIDRPDSSIRVVQVGHSLAPVHAVQREAIMVVGLASAGALLLSLAASWFLAGRALVPIRQALDRQRDFTADASHELRTPLSVIDTGIQLVRRHPDQTIEENAEVLESMTGQAQRMERLISDLLVLARADSGAAELQLTQVDVAMLVRGAVADLGPGAEARGIGIRTRADVPAFGTFDADRVRQLVVILLDNALKFSPAGGIVEVVCSGRPHGVQLEVVDEGPGIPANLRGPVFERFHRVEGSRTATGAGLGLAIAQWIVAAHGGSIALHDKEGPGLRVQVDLQSYQGARRGGRWRRVLEPLRRVRLPAGVHRSPIWRR